MNTRKFSKRQEKDVAKIIGGSVQSNSGATPFQKGDVKNSDFLIECKTLTTPQKSITLKKEWLTKLAVEKFSMNKQYSALAFDFGDGEQFFAIPTREFKQFLELLEELKND
jgi:hypothetical protein